MLTELKPHLQKEPYSFKPSKQGVIDMETKVRSLPQRLDSLSKILVATGQINYMAASIDSVNEQIKFIPDKEGFHKDGIKARDEILRDVTSDLAAIMQKMGNLINAQDCICAVDMRVAKVPFEILIEKMDECENDYESNHD